MLVGMFNVVKVESVPLKSVQFGDFGAHTVAQREYARRSRTQSM
jgi:hypothetical protein